MAGDEAFDSIEVGAGETATFYHEPGAPPGLASFSFKLGKQELNRVQQFAKAIGLGTDYDFELDIEGCHYRVKDGDWLPIPEEAKKLLPKIAPWHSRG